MSTMRGKRSAANIEQNTLVKTKQIIPVCITFALFPGSHLLFKVSKTDLVEGTYPEGSAWRPVEKVIMIYSFEI